MPVSRAVWVPISRENETRERPGKVPIRSRCEPDDVAYYKAIASPFDLESSFLEPGTTFLGLAKRSPSRRCGLSATFCYGVGLV